MTSKNRLHPPSFSFIERVSQLLSFLNQLIFGAQNFEERLLFEDEESVVLGRKNQYKSEANDEVNFNQ